MKTFFLSLIKQYQKFLGGEHGALTCFLKTVNPDSGCRFYPSCSEYSRLAIEKHGVKKGLVKSFKRIIKCGPWSLGGVDNP